MTTIRFLNGLREIGGTFAVIETDKARCMFDFGFAVAHRMDDSIKIRKDSCASDYVRLGVLACQDGIYDSLTADRLGIVSYADSDKESFFVISHMHIDHMGGLGMLDENIPVYMSENSLKLYRRLEAMGDIQVRGHKNCRAAVYGEEFTVGDIKVRAIPVDHDVIGACGYLITTPDGTICYTGDYRFHGFHPDVTMKFAQQCHKADVLITEGVTVSHEDVDMLALDEPQDQGMTEELLISTADERACAKGLVVINPYNRNVERMHRICQMAENRGRKLVADYVQADYIKAFYPEDDVYVYGETLPENAVPENVKIVLREELLAEPDKYILQLDYRDSYELMDLHPVISSYLHMDGVPLGDYDPSFEKMLELMRNLSIPYERIGTGGHAKPYYIRKMIDTIEPGTLIPLHSFRPEQVNSLKAGKRILPEFGDCYTMKNGELSL